MNREERSAWTQKEWYSHCDNLFHARQGFWLAGQLVAIVIAFGSGEAPQQPVWILGATLALLWWLSNFSLGEKLRRTLAEFEHHDEVVRMWGTKHPLWSWMRSNLILVHLLPWCFIVAWVALGLGARTC